MCGRCTFCTTGAGVTFVQNAVTVADPKQIQAILGACTARDDPRLLARFAFGISSPRLTVLKCSTSHPLFGSMVNVDFSVLLKVFDEECKKVDYENIVITVPTNTRKRSYTQTTGGTGSGRGGRGGYKRGRY